MISRFYIIPRIGGIAYLNMSKAACSSILLALSQMRRDTDFELPITKLPDGSASVHAFQSPYHQAEYFFHRWPSTWSPLPKSLIKFTFTRNPYDRFLSFFKSKILAQQRPGDFYRRFGITAATSFDDCVYKITSIDPNDLEHHAAPQSLIIFDGNELLVDFVGKLESIEADWGTIQDLTGFKIALPQSNVYKTEELEYTSETALRIYNYYRTDFELFGYSADDVDLAESRSIAQPQPSANVSAKFETSTLNNLKTEIYNRTSGVVSRAQRFREKPELRTQFLDGQHEVINELILKRIIALKEEIPDCKHSSNPNPGFESTEAILEQNRLAELERELFETNDSLAEIEKSASLLRTQLIESQAAVASYLDRAKQSEKLLIGLAFVRARRSFFKTLLRWQVFRCINEVKFIVRHGLIDAQDYFRLNPDAMNAGMSAAEHYVKFGAAKGLDPSGSFNTYEYIIEHSDVLYYGINPLVHATWKQRAIHNSGSTDFS